MTELAPILPSNSAATAYAVFWTVASHKGMATSVSERPLSQTTMCCANRRSATTRESGPQTHWSRQAGAAVAHDAQDEEGGLSRCCPSPLRRALAGDELAVALALVKIWRYAAP